MPKLAMFGRPYVIFNPENVDHRRWFAEFNRTQSWGKCPVRFVVDDDVDANLTGLMQRKIVEYYAEKEFGETEKIA